MDNKHLAQMDNKHLAQMDNKHLAQMDNPVDVYFQSLVNKLGGQSSGCIIYPLLI
jgi:hypothetical protein